MTAPVMALIALLLGFQTSSDLPTLALPQGEHAWIVRIVTTGGFTGRGAGNVIASSAGQVLCTLVASCPDRLVPETNRSLSGLVTSLQFTEPPDSRTTTFEPGSCNDCVTTNMTVQWRDAEGEHVVRYTWDLSTIQRIPDDVRRLHSALVDLMSPRSR